MSSTRELEQQIAELKGQREDMAIALTTIRNPPKYPPQGLAPLDFLKAELAATSNQDERQALLLKSEEAIASTDKAIAQLETQLAERKSEVDAAKQKVAQAIERFNEARSVFAAEILELQKAAAEVVPALLPETNHYHAEFPISGKKHLENLPVARQTAIGAVAIEMADSGAARDATGETLWSTTPWYKVLLQSL